MNEELNEFLFLLKERGIEGIEGTSTTLKMNNTINYNILISSKMTDIKKTYYTT